MGSLRPQDLTPASTLYDAYAAYSKHLCFWIGVFADAYTANEPAPGRYMNVTLAETYAALNSGPIPRVSKKGVEALLRICRDAGCGHDCVRVKPETKTDEEKGQGQEVLITSAARVNSTDSRRLPLDYGEISLWT